MVNPLRSGIHVRYKMLAGYFRLVNMPSEYNSLLRHVFSFLLVPSKLFMKNIQRNLEYILLPELQSLEDDGITFNYKGEKKTMKVILLNNSGDNLGIHQIHGFLCSFGSNTACCRICKANSDQFRRIHQIPPNMIKSKIEYNDIINREDTAEMSAYGIKSACFFNELQYFHVMDVPYVDIMHDLWEGHCRVLMLNVMNILHKKFRKDRIEAAINLFPYKFPDSRNKPTPFKYDTKKSEFLMTASAMKTFVRLLPMIAVKDRMDISDNIFWKILLKLQYIIDILLAPAIGDSMIQSLDRKIKEYVKMVSNSGMRFTIKTHLLLHYVDVIKQLGPLRHLSSIRYEAKHNYHKQYSNTNQNNIQPEKTIFTKESYGYSKLFKEMENCKFLA